MKPELEARRRALDSLEQMLHSPGGKHRNYRGALDEIQRLEEMPMTDCQRSKLALLRSDVEPYVNEYGVKHPIHWTEFEDAWISETDELILP